MGMNDEIFDRVARLGEQLQKLNNNRRLLDEARAKVTALPNSAADDFRGLRIYTPDMRSSLAYRRMDQQSMAAELIKERQS